MKLIKRILVIDDADQENVLEEIRTKLYKDFTIHTVAIKTSKPQLRQDGFNKLDFEKLKKAIDDEYKKAAWFELILTDFDLNEEGNVDGLDVVDYIKATHPSATIMMYSGNFTDAVKKIVQTDGALTVQQVADAVSKLVGYNILFPDRNDYKKATIDFIKGDKEISLRNEFLSLLYEHENMVFNSCYPEFAGKTFGEIAKMIEKHSDGRSEEWMSALIKQTIAYLVKVNQF